MVDNIHVHSMDVAMHVCRYVSSHSGVEFCKNVAMYMQRYIK